MRIVRLSQLNAVSTHATVGQRGTERTESHNLEILSWERGVPLLEPLYSCIQVYNREAFCPNMWSEYVVSIRFPPCT